MADPERPEPRSRVLYVDTSTLLKLLVREAESEVIETELLQWSQLVTSVVTEVELPRAIARAREDRSAVGPVRLSRNTRDSARGHVPLLTNSDGCV